MRFDLLRRFRSLVTLGVLLVVLLVGVSWGWSAVTAPLPESEDPPVCEDLSVEKGEKVYPDQVAVSVLNAGTEEGLAGRTMQALVDQGFVQAGKANAPARTDVAGAEVWADDPRSAAAILVASYLSRNGKNVPIRQVKTKELGVNVVVGDGFKDVVQGRKAVTAPKETTICAPPTE